MKIEYEISFVDALVIIDPERFKEMDEEFLYAFDIFLDKEGESELVCDFPGEDWKEVWDRETAVVQDFIEKSNMCSCLNDLFSGNISGKHSGDSFINGSFSDS